VLFFVGFAFIREAKRKNVLKTIFFKYVLNIHNLFIISVSVVLQIRDVTGGAELFNDGKRYARRFCNYYRKTFYRNALLFPHHNTNISL